MRRNERSKTGRIALRQNICRLPHERSDRKTVCVLLLALAVCLCTFGMSGYAASGKTSDANALMPNSGQISDIAVMDANEKDTGGGVEHAEITDSSPLKDDVRETAENLADSSNDSADRKPVSDIPVQSYEYHNPETGYDAFLYDDAELLSDAEKNLLLHEMESVTRYGGAAFVSGHYLMPSEVYRSIFGTDSGTIFVIDMGSRQITVYSDGAVYRTISKSRASLITDNVYRYASRGDYYGCASRAFGQIVTLLDGGRIAEPMRHVTNALAALVVAFLGNFVYVWSRKRKVQPDFDELVKAAAVGGAAAAGVTVSKNLIRTRKSHKVTVDSDGGGGGGFSGGGGGSSGGGGSHGF